MQDSTVDNLLLLTILAGLVLSIASLLVSVLNGRSRQMAETKANSNLRELYERTYRKTPFKTRRFVSIARPGKVDRRVSRDTPPD